MKRTGLMAAAIVVHIAWILALRGSGLEPHDAPVLRVVLIYGPGLVTAGAALVIALRAGLFTPAELGLHMPAWTMRRGRGCAALLLFAIFLAGMLIDIAGPIGTMTANGMSYEEIVAHLLRHEYWYTFGRSEPPPPAWAIGIQAVTSILAPLSEEVPYRGLLVPVVVSRLSRNSAALASGAVFFLVHWLAFGGAPHPAYFLHGWAFAWVFLLAGLPGSIAAHAGVCFGVLALATFAGFAGVQ